MRSRRDFFYCIAPVFVLALLLAPGNNRAETTAERLGVKVIVERIESDVKGFALFTVTARNGTAGERSVNGTIRLLGANKQAVGSCTVYLELPPNLTKSRRFYCQGTGAASFEFSIVNVYKFILDG